MSSQTPPGDAFMEQVRRLRAVYMKKRDSTNLVPPNGRPMFDQSADVVDGTVYSTYWYENDAYVQEQNQYQCIRLADIPSTLSGDILRLERNLPTLDATGNFEIIGDQMRPLIHAPRPPDYDDDFEDVNATLALLPEVEVESKHFLKKPKYVSEIQNLIACQGGSCPGVPISTHIIQLLGKSSIGELVFEKFEPRYVQLASVHPLGTYKAWILQVISGLRCLHSLGIVHRDLRIDNLLFSSDGSRLLICDLEGRWGNRLAPEVSLQPVLDAGWTQKSDIYDLGYLIKGMIYANAPITNFVEWDVPSPLDAVVEACTCVLAEERPNLDDLYAMVDKIEVSSSQDGK